MFLLSMRIKTKKMYIFTYICVKYKKKKMFLRCTRYTIIAPSPIESRTFRVFSYHENVRNSEHAAVIITEWI